MVLASLAIAGVSTLAVALTYGYVGLHLMRKGSVHAEGRPLFMLALWWLATAANQAIGGALYVAAAFGWTDFALQLTYVHLQRLLLSISLVALLYYLLYLQTGRRLLVPLAILYGLWWTTQVYAIAVRQPVGIGVFRWRTDIAYALAATPALESLALLIVVPPVICALMLLRVYRRLDSPTQRFRIAVLSAGFTVWWVVAVAAGSPRTFDLDAFQALNRLVGVAVALAVLMAYEPFSWLQRRYRLVPMPDQR